MTKSHSTSTHLTFFGAARQVTGSCYLLETPGGRILLECGMFQGHRAEAFERNRHLPFAADNTGVSHSYLIFLQ